MRIYWRIKVFRRKLIAPKNPKLLAFRRNRNGKKKRRNTKKDEREKKEEIRLLAFVPFIRHLFVRFQPKIAAQRVAVCVTNAVLWGKLHDPIDISTVWFQKDVRSCLLLCHDTLGYILTSPSSPCCGHRLPYTQAQHSHDWYYTTNRAKRSVEDR